MSSESWATSMFAITVVAEDLAAMKAFYGRVFDLPCVFERDTSAVFRFGETLLNIIDIGGAPELIKPARIRMRTYVRDRERSAGAGVSPGRKVGPVPLGVLSPRSR